MKAVDLLLRPRDWQSDAKKLIYRVSYDHMGDLPVVKRVRRMPDIEHISLIKEILIWPVMDEDWED